MISTTNVFFLMRNIIFFKEIFNCFFYKLNTYDWMALFHQPENYTRNFEK